MQFPTCHTFMDDSSNNCISTKYPNTILSQVIQSQPRSAMTYSFMTPNNYLLCNVASLRTSLDLLSLPPTCNTPLLPRKGCSLNKLLDRFTPLELCVPELSALTSSKNNFLCIILNMTVAAFSNILTFSSFYCLSDVCFLIFFIHWFLTKIIIAITLFIFNHFRVGASNLEMISLLILAKSTLTPFFSSGSLSVICLTALSPSSQVSLYDQRNSGPLNHLFNLSRFFESSPLDTSSAGLS